MQLGGSSLPRKRIQSLLMGLDSRPGLLSARVTFFRGDDKNMGGTSSIGACRGLSAGYGLSSIRKQNPGLWQQFYRFHNL